MPFHGQTGLHHDAVLWRRIGTDANGARPVVSAVAEGVKCRWDDSRRTVAGPDGNPIAVDATVIVDREIAPGSAMCKGSVDDLADNQLPIRDVFEVVTWTPTSDWRGVHTTHEVTLVKAGNTLPSTGTDPEG